MANIIIIKGSYNNNDAIRKVVNYIMDIDKTRGVVGAQGTLLSAPYYCMEQVQKYYRKTNEKLVQHIVLSFDDKDYITSEDACKIGYDICGLFPEYQVVFAVHSNKVHLHIHFCINPVNVSTGQKLNFGFKESFTLRKRVSEILKPYDIGCNLRMPDYVYHD